MIIIFKKTVIWDGTGLFIFLKSFTLGSLHILCPGGEDREKLIKIGSPIPFTMLPWIQSALGCTLSIPVMWIGLSLLYEPGYIW